LDKQKIAVKLKELREKSNLSRKKFADDLHISYSAACAYESGERIPRDEIKMQIAKYYGKTVLEIFFS